MGVIQLWPPAASAAVIIYKEDVMADGDNAATGGVLVILGIVVAIGLGIFFFKGDMFSHSSGPSVNIELPKKD